MALKKLSNEEKELCKMITPEFRVSHPHVFKASSVAPNDPKKKFSVTMLIRKDTDMMGTDRAKAPAVKKPRSIKQVILNAKVATFGADKAKWPPLESPVGDGDGEAGLDKNRKPKEGYAGHWVIKCTSQEDQRPEVRDQNNAPITVESDFYAGCFARAAVYVYVWEFAGKFGVSFILDSVQKLKDGPKLGGRLSADEDFSPVSSGEESEAAEDDDMDFK